MRPTRRDSVEAHRRVAMKCMEDIRRLADSEPSFFDLHLAIETVGILMDGGGLTWLFDMEALDAALDRLRREISGLDRLVEMDQRASCMQKAVKGLMALETENERDRIEKERARIERLCLTMNEQGGSE